MKEEQYCVKGMHCKSCEVYIESQFRDIKGISNIKTDSSKQSITFKTQEGIDSKKLLEEINKKIKDKGYTIQKERDVTNNSNIALAFVIALLLMILFWGLQKVGLGNNLFSSELSLPMVFVLGVIASLSSCMAVVGALVLSFSSTIAEKKHFKSSITIFHISRLIIFFILGGILGVLGSLILLTQEIQLIVNVLLFSVMIILGFDMLGIFPILQKFQLTIPKSISQKILDSNSKGYILTPIIFGLATFFLPCGFTQSMQIQSVLSGNFLHGSFTMLMFALGTLPILLLISLTSRFLTKSDSKDLFYKVAGFLVMFFAIYNLYGALVANGIIRPII